MAKAWAVAPSQIHNGRLRQGVREVPQSNFRSLPPIHSQISPILRIAKRSDGAAKRHSEEGILRVLREAESGHTVGVDAAEIGFYRRDPLEEKHHRNGRTTIEHPESLQEIACVKQFDLVQGYSY